MLAKLIHILVLINGAILLATLSCGLHYYRSQKGPQSGPQTPIILVPGDGGSQIEGKLNKPSVVHYFCDKKTNDYYNLWLNLVDLVPYVIDCWVDNIRLVYDNVTRRTLNSPGVDIRIPGFGNTSTIEYVDPSQVSVTGYFNVLVQQLVKLGYERGKTLRGAPYDFRRAPHELEEFYHQFKCLVEETFVTNGNQKVVIICHSLGCPVMLYFLNHQSENWKTSYIKSLVTLAGPWGGAVKALKAFSSGDNLGVIVIPALTIRKDERTFSSLSFLLPSDRFWLANETLIRNGNKTYNTSNYLQFFQDINYTIGYEMWLDTKDLIYDLKPPEVEVHCLHGTGVNTMEHLEYPEGKFPDNKPKISYGNGDGTVNIRSLEGCLEWRGRQIKATYHQAFTGLDHITIMTNSNVITYIKDMVLGEQV